MMLLISLLFINIIKNTNGDIIVFNLRDGLIPEDVIKDMAATFGPSLPYDGLQAQIVLADPPDGCTSISPPPKRKNILGKWAVLIQRYNCTFEDKVRNAQNASYDAVIVHNVNSSSLEPMSAKNPFGIHIPSVFINAESGLLIKTLYLYTQDYFVVINSEQPDNINIQLLTPFAIVIGICFVIMIGFMITKFIKDRMRQRRHRLPSSSLNKIPTCKFAKGDPYETCAICLDDYVEGEKLRVLPCAHAYHCKCIDPWLTKNRRVCPVCKRKVFAHDEQTIPDSDSDSDMDDTAPLINNQSGRSTHGTFAQQFENPFQRAARSVSQIANPEQNYSNEGIFVTASGDHSINTKQAKHYSSSDSSSSCSSSSFSSAFIAPIVAAAVINALDNDDSNHHHGNPHDHDSNQDHDNSHDHGYTSHDHNFTSHGHDFTSHDHDYSSHDHNYDLM